MVPLWQKKSVWQVTTIIQLALCHLVTSHFQEIACNWTPKDQIRWPIFLMLLCMIVLTEKTLKFPQPIIFWILVFSCHKMTLITKITWMPPLCGASDAQRPVLSCVGSLHGGDQAVSDLLRGNLGRRCFCRNWPVVLSHNVERVQNSHGPHPTKHPGW